jgi:hypothetical protein
MLPLNLNVLRTAGRHKETLATVLRDHKKRLLGLGSFKAPLLHDRVTPLNADRHKDDLVAILSLPLWISAPLQRRRRR